MNFTREELVNMVYCIGEADRNPLLASRIYHQKYPEARTVRASSFQKLRDRFELTGSASYTKKEIVGGRINEENELQVLLMLQENPHVSTREIAAETVISQSSVNRIILKHKFHPYHLNLHQELYGNDFANRVAFCIQMNGMIDEDYDTLNKILFTDEATFKNNGSVNKHNMHYYAIENPHWLRTVDHQNRWSLNVWGGIIGNHIIGPYFFDNVLNGERYLHFLREHLPIMLQKVDLNTRRTMWLQHDGASVHNHWIVREFLDQSYPNRWIGRGGTIPWPARSPDLTPMDFFLWGYVKERVFRHRSTTADDMKNRITEAFRSADGAMLARVRGSFTRRLAACVEHDGDLFEHL